MKISVYPVTSDRWSALEQLFGPKGACGGCWCMLDRLPRATFESQKGQGTRETLKDLVLSGHVPGLLAFAEKRPVGWCSLGPREAFPALERSKVRRAVDDKPVWSLVCFFIDKSYRGQGVSKELIAGAIDYAKRSGASILEAYPVEPKKKRMPDVFAHAGVAAAFEAAGFVEVARRSATRPVMRYEL